MAREKNLKLSNPSFYKRIEYVRNLLIKVMNKNSNLQELDKRYEEKEYLASQNLETLGRQAKLQRDKENEDDDNIVRTPDMKLDRFSKIKLGNRIGGMLPLKYKTQNR